MSKNLERSGAWYGMLQGWYDEYGASGVEPMMPLLNKYRRERGLPEYYDKGNPPPVKHFNEPQEAADDVVF